MPPRKRKSVESGPEEVVKTDPEVAEKTGGHTRPDLDKAYHDTWHDDDGNPVFYTPTPKPAR